VAKTYSELKAALGDWLGQNAVRLPLSVRGDLINLARRELCRRFTLRYNEASDTFATVSGTRTYALPATWSQPYQLWYLDADTGGRVDLDYKSKEEFDLLFPDSTKTAKPTHYTTWGSLIYLGKTPDRVLTVNRDFYAILADLSAEDDVDPLPWEAVLFHALADVSRYGIEDARIPLWQARAQEIDDQLVIESSRARSSGRRAESQEPG